MQGQAPRITTRMANRQTPEDFKRKKKKKDWRAMRQVGACKRRGPAVGRGGAVNRAPTWCITRQSFFFPSLSFSFFHFSFLHYVSQSSGQALYQSTNMHCTTSTLHSNLHMCHVSYYACMSVTMHACQLPYMCMLLRLRCEKPYLIRSS